MGKQALEFFKIWILMEFWWNSDGILNIILLGKTDGFGILQKLFNNSAAKSLTWKVEQYFCILFLSTFPVGIFSVEQMASEFLTQKAADLSYWASSSGSELTLLQFTVPKRPIAQTSLNWVGKVLGAVSRYIYVLA